MMRKVYLFITLVTLFISSTFAQRLAEFSEPQTEFLKQLKTYMTSSKQKVMEDIYKDFEAQFEGGAFTQEEYVQIRTTGNLMLGQKMTAKPYFSNYLQVLTIIKKGENGVQRFQDWHKILDQILEDIENRRLKSYKDYLAFSIHFFDKNALRYSTSGVTWTAVSEDYKLKYENKAPSIEYKKLDLYGSRKKDSIRIYETSGAFFPVEGIWKGTGGKVPWERFGLADEIYCVLSDFRIDVRKSIYEVKSVKLHYPELFPNKAVEGSFTDKIVASSNAKGGSYPRFESKARVLEIDNIGGGIKYKGGFRLHGTTVYGFGSKDNKANIAVFNDKQNLQFNANAELFVIRKGEKISGERAEITLYFGNDSLYHPSVNVKFDIAKKELNLKRGKRASDRNPFFNSLHQFNIDVDNIDWYMNSDSIVLGQRGVGFSRSNKKVTFESLKYFEEGDYRRLQNISTTNPLATLKVYADQEGTVVSANNLAQRLNPRFDVSSIQSLLYDLVANGFVNYDSDKQIVEVKDKVFHYADAYQGKVDYDVLKIISEVDSTNAVLSLKDNTITVNGVRSIQFSSRQRVAVRPLRHVVILKENRNMDFDGRVFAGFTTFVGKDFSYKYDKNLIEMDSVRYLDFYIPTEAKDEEGELISLSIGSRIEHLNGILLIDAPSNKSGIEDIPIFPSLQSKGPSYVYYDYSETQGGIYDRDSFYFKLDKFSFNGLDNYTKEDLKFDGKLVSANIFPEFKETIVLLEDESFGFETKTPEEGFPSYLGKGEFKGDIDLSNEGLLGVGDISYLGATVSSEDIVFKPNQLLATADRFELEEDRDSEVEVPKALGLDVSIDWKPYQDSMYIRTKEKAFELFKNGEATLEGTLILTPGGLKASGLLDWDKGSLTSKLISFKAYSALSDTSTVKIKTVGFDDLAIDTKNVNADLNFDEQIGIIKANSDQTSTTMPYNKYITSLSDFTWDMKEETITFKNESGRKGNFVSIHPDKDSLDFKGETAFYDLKTNELKISGVEMIQTCDAFILTEDGNVEISKGGYMDTLYNATIIADTVNKYHFINRATVNLIGKKDYRATGFYEYNIGNREQEIEFANIIGTRVGKGKRSEKKTVTRADGEVTEKDSFYIDHKTEYRGKINLNAESKNLSFKGFARLDAPNMPSRHWFSVQFEGDKNDLAITYDTPKNYQGDPLRTGIFLSKSSAKMYPSIMMPLFLRKDRVIMEAKGDKTGIYKYDRKNDQFNFGDSTKMVSNPNYGNTLTYYNKNGKIKAEGKINIGSGLDYISVQAAGRVETSFPDSTINMDGYFEPGNTKMKFTIMAGIDAIIPEKLLKIIASDIQSSSFDANIVDYLKEPEFYEMTLHEFIPNEKDYNAAVNKMKTTGLDLPGKYDNFEIFFSNLKMIWNAEYQSFISTDKKLGLGSINGEVINRVIEGYVEFKMPTNEDDRVYIYLKSPSEYYYFFGYKQGILSATSNNEKFNEALLNLKKKESTIKMEDGEFYEIAPVNQGTAQMFVNRILAARAQQ